MLKHFISIADTSREELDEIFAASFELREQHRKRQPHEQVLAGQTWALIFEKPSLRTRVSFEVALKQLGANTIALTGSEVGLGKRESVADVIRVLEGMVEGVVARVFEHQKLSDMAKWGHIPVVNALSDYSHPCQALADAMTMMDEFGRDLSGRTLAFIGDGNNVARSLATLCGRMKMNFVLASPPGYELEQQFVDRIASQVPTLDFSMTNDPEAAVHDADVIYTDTWVSMGQEEEGKKRRAVFEPFQVNEKLLSVAPKHAIVLHCLPAYRDLEISEAVLEGPQCRAFPEAHNRLHAQKGLLAVMGRKDQH